MKKIKIVTTVVMLVVMLGLALATFTVSAQTTETAKPAITPRQEVKVIRQNVRQQAQTVRQDAVKQNQDARQTMRQENQAARQDAKQTVQTEQQDARQDIKNLRQNVSTTKESIMETAAARRAETKQAIEQKREALKQAMETKRAEFQKQMEARKAEVKNRVAAQREELEKRLTAIKDEKKNEVVKNLDTKFANVNSKQLDNLSGTVNRLETALQNIGTRADKAEANGQVVSAVRSAIAQAETAITAAKNAIMAQSSKTYPINVTGETALKNAVSSVRQALQADLVAVRNLVKAAHEAVRKAATGLTQIPNIDAPTPTPAATSDTSAQTASSSN